VSPGSVSAAAIKREHSSTVAKPSITLHEPPVCAVRGTTQVLDPAGSDASPGTFGSCRPGGESRASEVDGAGAGSASTDIRSFPHSKNP